MFRLRLVAAPLLGLGMAGLIFGLHSLGGQQPPQPLRPQPAPPEARCLPNPLHWSGVPDLVHGVELVLTRYLRFETPEGRTINARMFLTEFHPKRVDFREDLPPDVLEKRRAVPSRMACIGHEIAIDEGYEPDFDVPVEYVKPAGLCAYKVSLGAVQCFVRTTDRKAE